MDDAFDKSIYVIFSSQYVLLYLCILIVVLIIIVEVTQDTLKKRNIESYVVNIMRVDFKFDLLIIFLESLDLFKKSLSSSYPVYSAYRKL